MEDPSLSVGPLYGMQEVGENTVYTVTFEVCGTSISRTVGYEGMQVLTDLFDELNSRDIASNLEVTEE